MFISKQNYQNLMNLYKCIQTFWLGCFFLRNLMYERNTYQATIFLSSPGSFWIQFWLAREKSMTQVKRIIHHCSCFVILWPLKGLHLKFHFTALGPLTQSITLIFLKKFCLKAVFQSGVESLFCAEKFSYYFKLLITLL